MQRQRSRRFRCGGMVLPSSERTHRGGAWFDTFANHRPLSQVPHLSASRASLARTNWSELKTTGEAKDRLAREFVQNAQEVVASFGGAIQLVQSK
jgi:hypothetical protein